MIYLLWTKFQLFVLLLHIGTACLDLSSVPLKEFRSVYIQVDRPPRREKGPFMRVRLERL